MWYTSIFLGLAHSLVPYLGLLCLGLSSSAFTGAAGVLEDTYQRSRNSRSHGFTIIEAEMVSEWRAESSFQCALNFIFTSCPESMERVSFEELIPPNILPELPSYKECLVPPPSFCAPQSPASDRERSFSAPGDYAAPLGPPPIAASSSLNAINCSFQRQHSLRDAAPPPPDYSIISKQDS